MSESTIVPAPSDMPAEQYIHKLSGLLIQSRPIAFKILGDEATPIYWPALTGEHWGRVVTLGNGYVTAHGRQALTAPQLAAQIRRGDKAE